MPDFEMRSPDRSIAMPDFEDEIRSRPDLCSPDSDPISPGFEINFEISRDCKFMFVYSSSDSLKFSGRRGAGLYHIEEILLG